MKYDTSEISRGFLRYGISNKKTELFLKEYARRHGVKLSPQNVRNKTIENRKNKSPRHRFRFRGGLVLESVFSAILLFFVSLLNYILSSGQNQNQNQASQQLQQPTRSELQLLTNGPSTDKEQERPLSSSSSSAVPLILNAVAAANESPLPSLNFREEEQNDGEEEEENDEQNNSVLPASPNLGQLLGPLKPLKPLVEEVTSVLQAPFQPSTKQSSVRQRAGAIQSRLQEQQSSNKILRTQLGSSKAGTFYGGKRSKRNGTNAKNRKRNKSKSRSIQTMNKKLLLFSR
jgi:hypothetical protein